eukprot:Sspe_Gene.116204::Locus_104922_Transcript_1_1_Confidence_1.000_Length_1187::g.116204::m.116204
MTAPRTLVLTVAVVFLGGLLAMNLQLMRSQEHCSCGDGAAKPPPVLRIIETSPPCTHVPSDPTHTPLSSTPLSTTSSSTPLSTISPPTPTPTPPPTKPRLSSVRRLYPKDTAHLPHADYAWAILLGTRNYLCQTQVAVAAIKKTNTVAHVVVITLIDVRESDFPRDVLVFQGNVPNHGRGSWGSTFGKLLIARLPYKKVMLIDSDVLVLQNMDHLFQVEVPKDSIAAPLAYWLGYHFLQTGGPLLVEPSPTLFEKGLEHRLPMRYDSEMDWLNEQYKHTAKVLDKSYAMLCGNWVPGDRIYHHFNSSIIDPSKGSVPVHMVHFIAGWKPANWPMHRVKAQYPREPELIAAYQKWWDLDKEVCHK